MYYNSVQKMNIFKVEYSSPIRGKARTNAIKDNVICLVRLENNHVL